MTANDSTYLNEEVDPSMATIQAQQRIVQLKKERDERMSAVVAESEVALASLRLRVEARREKIQQESAKVQAEYVEKMINAIDRRQALEEEMVQVIARLHSNMAEVEAMMVVGYAGREADARLSMQKQQSK